MTAAAVRVRIHAISARAVLNTIVPHRTTPSIYEVRG